MVPTSASDPTDLVCLAIGSNESHGISNKPCVTASMAGSTRAGHRAGVWGTLVED